MHTRWFFAFAGLGILNACQGNSFAEQPTLPSVSAVAPATISAHWRQPRAIGRGFYRPRGVTVDGLGNVYITQQYTSVVTRIAPPFTGPSRGTITSIGHTLDGPQAVAVSLRCKVNCSLYVADTLDGAVKRIYPSGRIDVLMKSGFSPTAVAVGPRGAVYTALFGAATMDRIGPHGALAPVGVVNSNVTSMAVDSQGVVFAAEQQLYEILPPFRGSTNGTMQPIGSGIDAYSAAVDASGNVFMVDAEAGIVYEVAPPFTGTTGGTISVVATGLAGPRSIAVDLSDNLYIVDTEGSKVWQLLAR